MPDSEFAQARVAIAARMTPAPPVGDVPFRDELLDRFADAARAQGRAEQAAAVLPALKFLDDVSDCSLGDEPDGLCEQCVRNVFAAHDVLAATDLRVQIVRQIYPPEETEVGSA